MAMSVKLCLHFSTGCAPLVADHLSGFQQEAVTPLDVVASITPALVTFFREWSELDAAPTVGSGLRAHDNAARPGDGDPLTNVHSVHMVHLAQLLA